MKSNKINTLFSEIFPNPLFVQQNIPSLRSFQINGVWQLFLQHLGWSSLTTLSSVLNPKILILQLKNLNRIGSLAFHRLSGICES